MKQIFLILIALLSACSVQPDTTEKTLVSWVEILNEDVKGGSILTIQDGEQFDGIIFSNREGGTWLAGSDEDLRTEKNPENASADKATSDALEQVAIVYEGNEIRIYRDAELQTSYEAENVDLLNSESNVVVFGSSLLGFEGWISASIEDARIYNQALSVEELKSLQPDEPSKIDPYAWWDFEGNAILDRTGRYGYHNTHAWEEVEMENGRLILEKGSKVVAARTYEPETPQWPEDPPSEWLTFHLAHPGPGVGFPGDPNPAWFYEGRYHMHYIYLNPYGFMVAHVSSIDMLHWQWHPTVLGPPKTGHGMFSGTGFFTREGQPVMIYHGFMSGRNQLMFGLDKTLDEWTDPQAILPLDEAGEVPDPGGE